MNLLENYIYLYHLDKFCVLPSMPDSITDSMKSVFSEQNALSRSAPVQSYINSGPRTVQFNLDLHRDIMEDLNKNISNLKDNVVDFQDKDYVDVLINYLQACALPKYNVYKTGSKAVDPPQVAVRMGSDIFIRGVITSGISVTYQKPILDNGKYAKVQIGITVTEVDPYDAPTVAMVGGFRGVTSMFKNGIYKGGEDSTVYSGQEYTYNTIDDEPTTLVDKTNPNTILASENTIRGVAYALDNIKKIDVEAASANTIRGLAAVAKPQTLTQKKVPGNNSLYIVNGSKYIKPTEDIASNSSYGSGNTSRTDGLWGRDSSPLNKGDEKATSNNVWHGYELAKRGNYN